MELAGIALDGRVTFRHPMGMQNLWTLVAIFAGGAASLAIAALFSRKRTQADDDMAVW